MNEIERLLKNINTFIDYGCLEEEMKVFAEEEPDLNFLNILNDIMEGEISLLQQ